MKNKTSKLTHFLNNACEETMKSARNLNLSESDFQRLFRLPEKNFNKNFQGLEIIKEKELKEIMSKFYFSITSLYVKQEF